MSADRVRWEHIQRIYEMCSRNVSETARRLNMHRRTLQRILAEARAALSDPRHLRFSLWRGARLRAGRSDEACVVSSSRSRPRTR